MSVKRTTWLSLFLLIVFLSVVADTCHAAWPSTEANRCWGYFDGDGTQIPGAFVFLHIVPVGRKTSVVTGEITNEGFWVGPVSGIAAIEGDFVRLLVQLGGYDPAPADSIYWVFNRSTLEMGNVLKQVPCRGVPR